MQTVKRFSTGYVPRKHQVELHLGMKRFNVVVCHRRFGKTVWSINTLIHKGLTCPHLNPQYAYIAPNYGQAKRVAWDMLKWNLRNIPGVETNEADLKLTIAKAGGQHITYRLLGAENPETLKGLYLDGAVFDEFAECDPRVWSETIRPALSDRLGWSVFMGTPRGQNHFYSLYQYSQSGRPDWFGKIYRASETGIIPQSELEDARAVMSEEEYLQEYECSFSAGMVGSYYGSLMESAEREGRITDVPYDPALDVMTAWDLGVGDTTAIWFFQQHRTRSHAIDYYEASGAGLDHYVKLLRSKPYVYGDNVFPHDVRARSLETGHSREESLRKLGVGRIKVLPKLSIDDGISAARLFLPTVMFDKKKCERGLEALRAYQKKWDSKNKIFSNSPLHNWASNGSDAFRYGALGMRDYDSAMSRKTLPRQAVTDYNIWGD